jgi:phosphatidylethanolamine/phosphatidyl-N-methylethanolamine N-methyltransferase
MSMWTFFREFTRDPVQLGAVAPSGEVLAKAMIEAADLKPGQVIVELGAGTGPMTAEILRARPDGPFVALEPNPPLAQLLRERFPTVRVEQRYAQDLRAILTEMGQTQADRVVSSLPWAIWSESLQNEVFAAILDVLAPDGLMVTFGYVHAQPLPAARRLRAALASRFETVELTPIAWRNLPPARVFVCRRPKKP